MKSGTDRDSGLQRVSRLTRWLVAGSVAAVGVISAVVAQALPGSSGGATTGTGSGTTPAAPSPISPPATSPTTTSPSVNNDTPIQPAPAPVPTPHRSVARSHAS